MKVGGLLVKTLAKPVARQLKVDAEHVGWLREACTSIGQTTNYLTSRLTHASSLDKWKKPYKHIELKATEAREKGAEIVSEGFVLTVAVTVMGYEYNRQNNYKEAAARRKEEKEAEAKRPLTVGIGLTIWKRYCCLRMIGMRYFLQRPFEPIVPQASPIRCILYAKRERASREDCTWPICEGMLPLSGYIVP